MLEQQLDEAVLEAIATLIVVLDREGRIVRFNPACERLTGRTQDEVLDKCLWELFLPEDQKAWAAGSYAEALEGVSMGHCDCDWITPNGLRRIRWTSSLLSGADGKAALVVCAGTDITEQFRSEELNRRIIETVPGGIVLVDREGAIRRANAEAERFLGLRFDAGGQVYVSDFRNKTVWEDGSECAVEDYPVSRCLRTGRPQPAATIGVVRPDGKIFWGVFTATPVHDPSGGPHNGAVVTFLDITDRKRTEQAIQAMNEHLEQLVSQRTEAARESERHYREVAEHNRLLVQEVEHRVRNNLAGLLGLVSVMQARVKDVKTFAGAIEGRLRAMTHVHQLLARADWRSLELRFLIESAISSMHSMSAFPAAVELEGLKVLVPPRRVLPLTLILLEWLTNSCKYGAHSMSGGKLRLSWQVSPSPRGPRVALDWQERGGPPVPASVTPSLGTELVHAFANRELGGHCEMRFPPQGAEHHLEFLVGTRADAGGSTPWHGKTQRD
jgi:PAS domain S-box-containing protein